MKKLLSIVLALAMLLTLTTVAASAEESEGTWKVAILTGTTSQGEEEFRAAEKALEKYGPEHIITDTYPDNFMSETETTISKLVAFASDPDVKAIVMCQAVPGATPGIQKIREIDVYKRQWYRCASRAAADGHRPARPTAWRKTAHRTGPDRSDPAHPQMCIRDSSCIAGPF